MSIYQPFTYLITHIPTGKRYYGVRYRKGCHPSDIGTKYFSSSKVIKKMIAEDGLDKFKFEVRRTFDTAEDAVRWEFRVLYRLKVWKNDDWLNIAASHKQHVFITHTDEMRAKISARMLGHTPWNKGKKGVQTYKKLSEEQKQKIRQMRNGFLKTDEIREKISISKLGKKRKAEECLALSKGAVKRWNNPQYRSKMKISRQRAILIKKAISFLENYGKRRPLGPYADQIRY